MTELKIEIKKVTIIISKLSTDIIYLLTSFPSSMPALNKQPLSIRFEAEHGTGVEYVKRVLGIPKTDIEIIWTT